ncbi:hypothetical protein [Leptospira interrogans]|nr:hypothetical protein [Leptospira interrogans]
MKEAYRFWADSKFKLYNFSTMWWGFGISTNRPKKSLYKESKSIKKLFIKETFDLVCFPELVLAKNRK